MHGQSNAVNSPASSVQNPSASSQHVQQPVQKPKTTIHSKTVRSLTSLNTPGQPPNVDWRTRKRAEIKHTCDQTNLFLKECQSLTPDLAARCIQYPIEISDDILVREPSLLPSKCVIYTTDS